MNPERVQLFGISIDNVTLAEAVQRIDALLDRRGRHYVVTPNVDHIVRLPRDPAFADAYYRASLIFADGMPIVWASRLLRRPLKGRVTGSDLVPEVCELAARRGASIFFLGTTPPILAEAVRRVTTQWPSLQIVGTYSPPFGFERNTLERLRMISAVNDARPDILFIGLGAPKQELWIANSITQVNVRVALCIGAGIDYLAGAVKRAPRWMQRTGLEWAWRLLQEPGRLWRRYLVEDMQFLGLLAREFVRPRALLGQPQERRTLWQ